jgi:hypothetical protein
MNLRFLVVAALAVVGLLFPFSAKAADSLPANTVPLVSFSVGKFDQFENSEQDPAADFRFEYRFGQPFWYVLKPLLGVEATSDGGAGVFAGIVADWLFRDHIVFAPSFSVGLWGHGDGKDLGSAVEFRSQLEAGYRFDNDWRLTGALSHISNADLGDTNPGVEIVSMYLHVPAATLLPR